MQDNLMPLIVGYPAFEGSPLIDPKLTTEQAKVNDIHLTLYASVMYDSYLLKDVHSVLVNFPREYAQESMMLYI